jgi:hypothetical protein
MCVLAHVLAEAMEARPLTDHPQLGEAYLNVMGASPRGSDAVRVIAQDLDVAVPDLRDVDLRAWLAFRNKHRRELMAYRESVTRLARELAGAEDEDEALSVAPASSDVCRQRWPGRSFLRGRLPKTPPGQGGEDQPSDG